MRKTLLKTGLACGLAMVVMIPGCKELLEETTDVRVVTQTPAAGSCGTTPTTISIQFSGAMDATSVSATNSGGACTANVQVSSNNFTTCVNFTAAPSSTDQKSFVYTPAVAFTAGVSYKIKVRKTAKTSDGNTLSSEYISASGFGDGDQVVISEVGYCHYTNESCWIEIYNKSSQCSLNLGKYYLRSTYYPSFNKDTVDNFLLPTDTTVPPGGFVLLRGLVNAAKHFNSNGQIFLLEETNNRRPYWTNGEGALDLVHKGADGAIGGAGLNADSTADFVRFGTSTATATTGTDMAGVWATMWPTNVNNIGKSIARDANMTDNGNASDWTQRTFSTPAAPNDVTCATDADNDGIPDCSEVAGSTFAGLNLYSMGARTGQRDIFIEIDYMDSTDPGVIPQKEALDKVKQVFAGRGYKVHFDVGSLYHPGTGISEADHDLGNATAKVPFAQGIELGAASDKANFYTYKYGNMDPRRRGVFYYGLFAYSRNADGSAGSSGVAEVDGNDFIISLGNWGLVAGSNRLVNFQASTLMHEWGHNLGLLHGGDDNENYKPNYLSIMNYHYQLAGLPLLNNNPGDRYYLYRRNTFGDCSLITSNNQLTNHRDTGTFIMDFSDGATTTLQESNINESHGLRQGSSNPVDFNCNGSIGTANMDLNDELTNTQVFNDFNDWNKVNSGIIFMNKYAGVESGYFTTVSGEAIHIDPIGNDRQPVIHEADIPGARQ